MDSRSVVIPPPFVEADGSRPSSVVRFLPPRSGRQRTPVTRPAKFVLTIPIPVHDADPGVHDGPI
jgi:hypothetical protein